jgi:hypothetical protein
MKESDLQLIQICSSITPTSDAKPDQVKIENDGNCPSCNDKCYTYSVDSKEGSVITFTPCCGETKTSPYVVTEVSNFPICSTTVPTSNDPNSDIRLKATFCESC